MESFSMGFMVAGIIVFGLSICAIVAGSQGMQSKVYVRKGPMTDPPVLLNKMGRRVPIPPPPMAGRLSGTMLPPTGSHETDPFANGEKPWRCAYCRRLNLPDYDECRGCGSVRDEGKGKEKWDE